MMASLVSLTLISHDDWIVLMDLTDMLLMCRSMEHLSIGSKRALLSGMPLPSEHLPALKSLTLNCGPGGIPHFYGQGIRTLSLNVQQWSNIPDGIYLLSIEMQHNPNFFCSIEHLWLRSGKAEYAHDLCRRLHDTCTRLQTLTLDVEYPDAPVSFQCFVILKSVGT
jgi:hypothetical protein